TVIGFPCSGRKFSIHRMKIVQRTRVLPSTFLYPVLKSKRPSTRNRFHSDTEGPKAPSTLGIVRPRYTTGALPHATEPPFPSSHRTLMAFPAPSSWALTTRFANHEPTG